MKPRAFRIALLVVLGAAAAGRAADVDVIDWALSATVTDSSVGPPQSDFEYSDTPQNPYMHTLSASTSPEDTAVGVFDVSWLSDSGEFHLAAEHHLHGPDRDAGCGAVVYIATDTDIVFNVSASMNYASSPGDEASFYFGLGLQRIAPGPLFPIFSEYSKGGDFYFETPASGSLSLQTGDILLSAGFTYSVSTTFDSDTYTPPDQDPISASAEFSFSWHAVPEPATALLMAIAGVAITRRRRPTSACRVPLRSSSAACE